MANDCNVAYNFKIARKDLDTFKSTVIEGKDYVDIVKDLGAYKEDMYLRGYVEYVNISDTDDDELLQVQMECVTGWSELPEFRYALEEKFDTHILFSAEEPGCEYYETNDADFSVFDQYLVYFEGDSCEYFNTADEVCKYVSKTLNVDVKTLDDAYKACINYNENCEDEYFIHIYEFEVV